MSRTKWKGPIISDTTSKQQKLYLNRNSQILPKHVGLKVVSHNGKENIEILVEESMVGIRYYVKERLPQRATKSEK